jgi:hypothetical protein
MEGTLADVLTLTLLFIYRFQRELEDLVGALRRYSLRGEVMEAAAAGIGSSGAIAIM